jgi:hypothetical protein
LLLAHVWFANSLPRLHEPNQSSRLYLALAIAEQGSFRVDEQVARHGRVEDLATRDGHWYSDKAPGASFLLAPIAWLLRATVLPPGSDPNDARRAAPARRLAAGRRVLDGDAFLLGGGGRQRRARAVVVTGALGTPFFVYAPRLFPHVQAGMLAFAAFLAIRAVGRVDRAVDRRGAQLRVGAAGFALALASITDYLLLFAVPVLSDYAVW